MQLSDANIHVHQRPASMKKQRLAVLRAQLYPAGVCSWCEQRPPCCSVTEGFARWIKAEPALCRGCKDEVEAMLKQDEEGSSYVGARHDGQT
jgi:hypothetical protein